MKNRIRVTTAGKLLPLFVTAFVIGIYAPSVFAQNAGDADPADDPYDIMQQYNKSSTLMEDSNWDGALAVLNGIIKNHEPDVDLYGPSFGIFYYRKGFCLKMKKDFSGALAAYNKCYKDYANKPDTEAAKQNQVWIASILEIASVHQALENWEEARDKYREFMRNEPEKNNVTFNKTKVAIQHAICTTKAGNIKEGADYLARIFDDPQAINLQSDDLYSGIMSLVGEWVQATEAPAKVEEEANGFLDQHLHKLKVTPWGIADKQHDARLLGFARTAVENEMPALAARLYSMIVSPDDVIADLNQRMAGNPNPPPRLLEEINKAKAKKTAENSVDVIAQINLAALYEKMRNYRAAFVIFESLEHQRSGHKYYPEFLFGATRCAAISQDWDSATVYGIRFLEKFPNHKYAASVSELLLPNLFFVKRDYDRCIDIATKIRARFPDPKDEKGDIADFVIGGSHFYKGEFEIAEQPINTHITNFPESKWIEHSLYYQASNLQRLRRPEEAAPKLDAFLGRFPKSGYRPYALQDRSECHLDLAEHMGTIEKSDLILAEFPDFDLMERTRNIRGDAYYTMETESTEERDANLNSAEDNYLEGKKLAQAKGRDDAAAWAMNQLISVYGDQGGKETQIVAIYDEFVEKYKGNVYEARVVDGSIPALAAVGGKERALEGIAYLKDVIIRIGGGEQEGINLEETINSYVSHFLQNADSVKDVEADLIDFSGGERVNDQLNSWILISLNDLYEDEKYKEEIDPTGSKRREGFRRLIEMGKGNLDNYIVRRTADYLAEQKSITESTEWYDQVIAGPTEDPNHTLARMGKAGVLAMSTNTENRAKAIATLNEVIADLKESDPETADKALKVKADTLFKMAQNGGGKQSYQAAADTYLILINERSKTNDPTNYYNLGLAFEALEEWDSALKTYTPFFTDQHQAVINLSCPARLRAAKIQAEKKGNKEKAYELTKDTLTKLHKYLNSQDFPDAAVALREVATLYKSLQADLAIEPDIEEEALWGIN